MTVTILKFFVTYYIVITWIIIVFKICGYNFKYHSDILKLIIFSYCNTIL